MPSPVQLKGHFARGLGCPLISQNILCRNWHRVTFNYYRVWQLIILKSNLINRKITNFVTGCRGINGPVPPPLWIRVPYWGYRIVPGCYHMYTRESNSIGCNGKNLLFRGRNCFIDFNIQTMRKITTVFDKLLKKSTIPAASQPLSWKILIYFP